MRLNFLLPLSVLLAGASAAIPNPSDITRQAIDKGRTRSDRIRNQKAAADTATCNVFDPAVWTFTVRRRNTATAAAGPAGGRLAAMNAAVGFEGVTGDGDAWYTITAISPLQDEDGDLPNPDTPNAVYYQNGYNPTANWISVVDINRNNPSLPSATDVTWALWRFVKNRAGATDYGALRGVIHYTCRNRGAEAVAANIFNGAEGVRTFVAGDDEYFALLGIDNGVMATIMLTTYPESMGPERQLASITAWSDGSPLIGVAYNFS